ncbi:phage holin family protein [Niallia sp. XMNu-256]|uniref:phage holin family protein n=1 Tax=Niallia sp. XMNu-256 TaxID=3082444 RepID=UPI0030CD1065
MDFPTIHTNFWDAVIAVPLVMVLTQMIKKILRVQKKYIPFIAVIIGYIISIFISHRGSLLAGIFMGYFYGYAAIGSYASLKTSILAFKKSLIKKYRKQPT